MPGAPPLSHRLLQEELDRLLAAGCPQEHVSAVLGRWADFAESCRVLAIRKAGHRGNDELTFRLRSSAGRQLMPEEMEAPKGSPLLTPEPS
jgi:hypothetical protein